MKIVELHIYIFNYNFAKININQRQTVKRNIIQIHNYINHEHALIMRHLN